MKVMYYDLKEIRRKLEAGDTKRKLFVFDCAKLALLSELEEFFAGYGFSD